MEGVTLCHFGVILGGRFTEVYWTFWILDLGGGLFFGMAQKCDLGVRYYPAVGLSLLVIPVSIYTPLWEGCILGVPPDRSVQTRAPGR